MATERQLRQRMRELEAALARQEQESRQIQQRIAAQTQEQIRQMQQQAQREFQRKLNETADAYAQRIRQFQEDVLRQNNKQMEALQKEADKLRAQTKETLQKMEACNKELQEELKRLKEDTARQERVFSQTAEEAKRQAEEAGRLAAQTPHDFFCPSEFDIISGHIQDIASLIDMGMYQAAVSDAGCLELEFRLLQTKVKQAFSEWMQAFEDYRAIINMLHAMLKELEDRSLQTSAGQFRMKPRELNFWSCGAYAEMAQKITTAYDTFHTMDQEQIIAYLRSNAGTNRQAIYTLVTQGKKWEDQLTAVINCITSERILSDQRITAAQDIASDLESLNYQVEVIQFCPPDGQTLEKSWYIAGEEEDPLGCFDLHMAIGQGNLIRLRFIPRRLNGLAVQNVCFLSVDLCSAADPLTERVVAQEALGHINSVLQANQLNIQVQFIPRQDDPETVIHKQERMISPPPSADAQMRYLERKYQ